MKITLTLTDGAIYQCTDPNCGQSHQALDILMRDEKGQKFSLPTKHQDLTRAQAFALVVMNNFDILSQMADALVVDGVKIDINQIVTELETLQSSPTAPRQLTH